jgi:hypothetical protein
MDIKELEDRLVKSQEKVDKAIILKGKYEAKADKIKNNCITLTKINPEGKNESDFRSLVSNDDPNRYEKLDLLWDYLHTVESIKDTERKIKELSQVRDNWKTKIELQKAKDSEFANIPQVVKDFVHNWRIKTEEWIHNRLNEYTIKRKEVYDVYEKAYDYSSNLTSEERKALKDKYNEMSESLRENTEPLILSIYSRGSEKEDFIKKLLDEEEKGKVLDLIRRVTKVTGTIRDASGLTIGNQSGELNGIVIGDEGKAHVETIGAGGYNIQRFHYRVLVKRIRG